MNEQFSMQIVDKLRSKAEAAMEIAQKEWSAELLQQQLGNLAGYMLGIADGIELQLKLQKGAD